MTDMKKKLIAFEKRLKHVETLLKGVRGEERWSLAEIQEIIDRTDLTTDMERLALRGLSSQYAELTKRLELAEGNILNLQMSHRGHVNYNPVEFASMHGYRIENLKKLKGPIDSQPVSKYVTPGALQSLGKMIHHSMRFATEMLYLTQYHKGSEVIVTAQAQVTGLVELAGLKLEVD